jgi:hypothetical protein
MSVKSPRILSLREIICSCEGIGSFLFREIDAGFLLVGSGEASLIRLTSPGMAERRTGGSKNKFSALNSALEASLQLEKCGHCALHGGRYAGNLCDSARQTVDIHCSNLKESAALSMQDLQRAAMIRLERPGVNHRPDFFNCPELRGR